MPFLCPDTDFEAVSASVWIHGVLMNDRPVFNISGFLVEMEMCLSNNLVTIAMILKKISNTFGQPRFLCMNNKMRKLESMSGPTRNT